MKETIKTIFTLGINKLIQVFKAANVAKRAFDINKDGKTTLKEVIQVGKDFLDGKATIKIEYKK